MIPIKVTDWSDKDRKKRQQKILLEKKSGLALEDCPAETEKKNVESCILKRPPIQQVLDDLNEKSLI